MPPERPTQGTPVLRQLILQICLVGVFGAGAASAQQTDVVDRVRQALTAGDPETAAQVLMDLRTADAAAADSARSGVMDAAVNAFQEGERSTAIAMMEAAKKAFPDHRPTLSVLGQFYWYEGNRPGSIENFSRLLEMDPAHTTASRFWDLLYFVPDEFTVPARLRTRRMTIRPLAPADVELDYRAVMGSADHLRGTFGPDDDWPTPDLTLEDDLRALKGHEREHRERSAFTFTVMNHAESEVLGCVYLLPVHHNDYDAQVFFWVTQEAFEAGMEDELSKALRQWLEDEWPFGQVIYPGRDMDWETYEGLVGG